MRPAKRKLVCSIFNDTQIRVFYTIKKLVEDLDSDSVTLTRGDRVKLSKKLGIEFSSLGQSLQALTSLAFLVKDGDTYTVRH